ncbi:MAG: alkaline shock response membrane anchor protein AmaP [Firmicutes bacterium]|nr:alkaline shock response membrane anchor protein AmaP [Bacillota bacterium]
MGAVDRVLFVLFTLAGLVCVAVLALAVAGWPPQLPFWMGALFTPEWRPPVLAVLLFFMAVGGRLLWVGTKMARPRAVVHEHSLGQVAIGLPAIEGLVRKEASQIPGVREVRARIYQAREGIAVEVRASVTPDRNVPELSKEMQERIKLRIHEIVGVAVNQVRVRVEEIAAARARVE